jgi:hypothetical protein
MKHDKINHKYKGYGVHPSECIIHIISEDDKTLIIFEDIGIGTSVTNSSEQLATYVVKSKKLDPSKCEFFETYPDNNYESFDKITYNWHKEKNEYIALDAHWAPGNDKIKKYFKS